MADDEQKLRAEGEAQLQRLQRFNKAQALERLKALDPYVFEHLTAVLFERRGYTATTMGGTGDQGVDILLEKAGRRSVVQCKRYENNVGQPTVRDLYGTMIHNHAGESHLVTTAMITRQAQEWARGKPIHLIDGFTLVDWIMQSKDPSRRRIPWAGAMAPSASTEQPAASPRRLPRFVTLALITLAIALFGFAVGTAYFRIEQRWDAAPQEDTASVPADPTLSAPAAATVFVPLAAKGGVDSTKDERTVEPVSSPPAASTERPAAAPTETNEPVVCQTGVDPRLESLYDSAALGCAGGDANMVWAAWQPFERGYMLWRSDTDAAYAFLAHPQPRWLQIEERWDGKPLTPRGTPPPGLQAPQRGFGYVWGIRDDLYQALGWSTDKEKGFCALVQPFEHGFVLHSDGTGSCTPDNLYNQASAADWKPLALVALSNGGWNDTRPSPSGDQDGISPTRHRPGSLTQRPTAHGLYSAPHAASVKLDARFDEWPGAWTPLRTVVYGTGNHSGSPDLAGQFQTAWSPEGLYLALQARDDVFRSGPDGTDMWQGDGLEIHFDRRLTADFSAAGVDEDDYQIGISFGPGLDEIRAYRWYPYDREGQLRFDGSAAASEQGYDVEVLIPWSVFEVSPGALIPGASFGFNLSISDNDGETAGQQTVLSASPARTTYDDPTEWGTLVLGD